MRILLSAYACRPYMGSEPAVGWNWVKELSRFHDLTVLTNYTNRPYIEAFNEKNGQTPNVEFVYVRPNPKLTFWYKEWKQFERLYYILWQKTALGVARRLNEQCRFDVVQHLTYVTCVLPTYMYKLGIPFIYGPISGGEKIPKVIGLPMSFKEQLVEVIRGATQLIPRFSWNTRRAFHHAAKIIAVTEDTVELIPKRDRNKVEVCQAISLGEQFFAHDVKKADNQSSVKILIAGRMLAWKGFAIGIEAAMKAMAQDHNIELTVLGSGDDKYHQKLVKLAGGYCGTRIHFIDSVDFEEMASFYAKFDILLNCSLRDSGCLVVMEAMACGLPVICVNTGGPAVNTAEDCAIKVAPTDCHTLVDRMSDAILYLSKNKEIRELMGRNARLHALNNFSSSGKIKHLLKIYEEVR